MIKRNILKNVAKPVGNYPHSIEVGEFLFISGIGPRQCDDNSIPGNEYDSSGNLINYSKTLKVELFSSLNKIKKKIIQIK